MPGIRGAQSDHNFAQGECNGGKTSDHDGVDTRAARSRNQERASASFGSKVANPASILLSSIPAFAQTRP